MFQRLGVAVVRAGLLPGQRVGGVVEPALGLRDAGAPAEETVHRLAGTPVGFLREVAHRRRRRAQPHRTLFGTGETGQQAEQRGLARTVRADQPDHLTRAEDEIQLAEQLPSAVSGGQAFGDEGGAHGHERYRRRAADSRGFLGSFGVRGRPPPVFLSAADGSVGTPVTRT